jgi:hypothetical protein
MDNKVIIGVYGDKVVSAVSFDWVKLGDLLDMLNHNLHIWVTTGQVILNKPPPENRKEECE